MFSNHIGKVNIANVCIPFQSSTPDNLDVPRSSAFALPGKFTLYYRKNSACSLSYGFTAHEGVQITGGSLELGFARPGEGSKVDIVASGPLAAGTITFKENTSHVMDGVVYFIKVTLHVPNPPKSSAAKISKFFARSCTGELI